MCITVIPNFLICIVLYCIAETRVGWRDVREGIDGGDEDGEV